MSFLNTLKNALGLGNTLYIPDCTTKFKLPKIYENYKHLLQKSGVKFIELDHICVGSTAINTGYRRIFEKLCTKNNDIFKEHNVTTIITNDEKTEKTLKEFYTIPTLHITEVISGLKVSDTIKEFQIHGKDVSNLLAKKGHSALMLPDLDCGSFLLDHQPTISEELAKIATKNTNQVITSDPRCYLHLKELGINVFELSEILL